MLVILPDFKHLSFTSKRVSLGGRDKAELLHFCVNLRGSFENAYYVRCMMNACLFLDFSAVTFILVVSSESVGYHQQSRVVMSNMIKVCIAGMNIKENV